MRQPTRPVVPVVFARNVPIVKAGRREQDILTATLTVPKPIVEGWNATPRYEGSVDTLLFADSPYEYIVLRVAQGNARQEGRHRVSTREGKGSQVLLPQRFHEQRRRRGDSWDMRIAQYGDLAIVCTKADMEARALMVATGRNDDVTPYPDVTSQQLTDVLGDIENAPKTRVLAAAALSSIYLECMFPGATQPIAE